MKHVSFVILHYVSFEYTQQCIDSILNNISYDNFSIIIVDNHSPNDSAEKLKEHYQQHSNIIILSSETNCGFAKGNNIGYRYAKNVLHSSYIVAANNDTLFTQTNFIHEMISLYELNEYYILGPDIVTLENIHQNPYRSSIIDNSSAKRWYRNRKLWTTYLKLDKFFKLRERTTFVQKVFLKRQQQNNSSLDYTKFQTNVVLQGACIIFSPSYITQMDYAFYPETYMYCEEDILAYLCYKKGWKILYSPSMAICHAECASTKEVYNTSIDKEIFQSSNIVKSLKILLKLMKE